MFKRIILNLKIRLKYNPFQEAESFELVFGKGII